MAKLIPIIATRNTDEIQQAIATGRPLLGSSPIDPTVYENETPTAAKAKYLLAIKSKGEVSVDEVAAKAAAKSSLSEIDVRLVLNAMYEVIVEFLERYGGAIKMFGPFGVFETMVRGSVENVTDPIDPAKNYAYLNMTPNDPMRMAVKTLAFFNATEKTAPYKVGVVSIHGTNTEDPFRMGTDVDIHGRGFLEGGATVKFVDCASGEEHSATVKENTTCNVIVATVPTSLNSEHKYRIVVNQTIDGIEHSVGANKQGYQVLPAPQPDHEILLVKHGDREDNNIAFVENQPVVCTVAHHNGAGYELKSEKPVKIVLDYENQRHVYAVLDTQTIVSVNETTVSFMNDENDTEEVDGSFWNHDVELTLYFADGGSATKTVRFVQL